MLFNCQDVARPELVVATNDGALMGLFLAQHENEYDCWLFWADDTPDARAALAAAGVPVDEYYPCSLCGASSGVPVGAVTPAWVLCGGCEGTPDANAAGYTHQ